MKAKKKGGRELFAADGGFNSWMYEIVHGRVRKHKDI